MLSLLPDEIHIEVFRYHYNHVMKHLLDLNEDWPDENADYFEKYENRNNAYCESIGYEPLIAMWCLDMHLWKPLPSTMTNCTHLRLSYILYDNTEAMITISFEAKDKTWADLYERTDYLIQHSGDHHHTFIEGYDVSGDILDVCVGS